MNGTRLKRTAIASAWMAAAMFLLGLGGAHGLVKEGNKLFSGGQYGKALVKYTDAQLKSPDEPRLHYNIGTVLYKQKKFDRAAESFKKVISLADEKDLKQKAWYNLGNSRFRQAVSAGDAELLGKAVDAYTEALKIDPNDKDAKYNLEVARKMFELKKEQQRQDKQSASRKNRESGPEKEGKQKNKGDSNEESKTATGEKQVKPEGEESETATQEAQTGRAPLQPEGKMTREEAERLLKAFEEHERRNMRDMRRGPATGREAPGGKDW